MKFKLLGRGPSGPRLPVENGASEIEASAPPSSRDESNKGPPSPIRRLLGKVTNRSPRSARSARQSPISEPATASSRAKDHLPAQTTQDPSPLTAPASDAAPNQASNSDILKVYHQAKPPPDTELVKATLAHAKADFEGIGYGSGMAQNTAAAYYNLQSDPNTSNMFSAILGPLKKFNDVANGLADVHPYAKVALSIFTFASKVYSLPYSHLHRRLKLPGDR
ncbi:uncharacterized protein EDB91DRAFT_1188839 [Suillus paluster]|uniref:uncharacterized protein n=1 Tax=Suillus paluster TaxID=48578 RepID=UPI001B86BCD0|nr:uncharacterized protein EDB91DRAFT_1188839 [Suillus paluster]KAG1717780.1 hypothetical protein EDB91DRAFT_1188839 [Suillus paluster]